MTHKERIKRIQEMYGILADELDSHVANGSEFIHREHDGSDSPPDVVALRLKVLGQVIRSLEEKAKRET